MPESESGIGDKEPRSLRQRPSRAVKVGTCTIGSSAPIAVQSMCATKTANIEATLAQIHLLECAGAHIIRIAVDNQRDVEALQQIRKETAANLVIDLQENFQLARAVAPLVQKLRYNPGHLHHSRHGMSIVDKVKFLVDIAGANSCALRIGVNFGSLDPARKAQGKSREHSAVESALEHCELVERCGFSSYVVSLKSSNPLAVVEINRRFAALRPEVPLHLGVTEAGLPPEGIEKTRSALVPLLAEGIGDTLRVSLTLPDAEKDREVRAAYEIIEDAHTGRVSSAAPSRAPALNVISCPSCSRVENQAFVSLAQHVKEALSDLADKPLTVAVMGCRVNGPGETDEADIGLWCAPGFVNLKRGHELIGRFSYAEVIARMREEAEDVLRKKQAAPEQ
ncbi:MAG TPA: flavodoxin/ferredoxin-dependent (E)-4-hydroxy-3-methylbut-2-enyl-diphosphate synthase [Oligoflexia bacterium]|nr:flavodoxin/ferredoxin-dependent (E)-4-hydroxy-3-methylbut-2-enyl-diphosphate synthase [Oligoflexia bacterium]